MNTTEIRYIDYHGLKRVYPVSDRTVYRLEQRETDPFPAHKIIGRKRFWILQSVLDWLERQDDAPVNPPWRQDTQSGAEAGGQHGPGAA